ncbi:MAG: phosphoglycerate mutase family protein [Deltaproteobacteria bacterium]|nr:phosphoglycerate mutase family protein [Deltaproteobacteria bacterium]
MSIVMFVRHGQGTLDGGQYDRLSDLGKLQAERLGHAWSSDAVGIDYVYTGTQRRHRETAEIVVDCYRRAGLSFPAMREDMRFNEIDSLDILDSLVPLLMEQDARFRDLVEKTKNAMKKGTPDKIELFDRGIGILMDAWVRNIVPRYRGLTWDDFRARVLSPGEDLARHGKDARIAVFTSGNPIGVYVKEALKLNDAETLAIVHDLFNANVTTMEIHGGVITLASLNDVAHLPHDQRTKK